MFIRSLISKFFDPFWIQFSLISKLSLRFSIHGLREGVSALVLIFLKAASLIYREYFLQNLALAFCTSLNSLMHADSSLSLLLDPRFSISTNLSIFFHRSATLPMPGLLSLRVFAREQVYYAFLLDLLGRVGETVFRCAIKLIWFQGQDNIYRSGSNLFVVISFCSCF